MVTVYSLLMGADYIFKLFFPSIASWYDRYVLYYFISPLYELIFLLFLANMLGVLLSIRQIDRPMLLREQDER